MSSIEFGVVGALCAEDLSCEVALLAADDFWHGHALCGEAVSVGPAARAVAQPDDGGDMQCTVAGAIAAAVEAVWVSTPPMMDRLLATIAGQFLFRVAGRRAERVDRPVMGRGRARSYQVTPFRAKPDFCVAGHRPVARQVL